MKHNITTIIFDFDGTIADTKKSILVAIKETLEHFSLPLVEDGQIENLIGLPINATFEKAACLSDEMLNKAVKEYRKRYNEIALKTVKLFPGVADTLETLNQRNVNLAVASNKGKDALKALLSHLGIDKLFSFVAGEQDVINKKPAPDMAELIIKELNISYLNTMIVGDTTFDIEMG
ncbi:MAG: HAD family hydrolase, partial [Nitrospirae bacterium]|nr:HAD family hydrolase [Nitrospirota bacterium]